MQIIRRLHILRRMSTIASKDVVRNGKGIIAVCQMTAGNNKEENLNVCTELVKSAKRFGAQMIFFPEACDYIGENKDETLKMSEPLNGNTVQQYRNLAKSHNVWLSLGGIHERVDSEHVKNTHVVIDSSGNISSSYSKLHLFDVDYPEGKVFLKESSYCQPGMSIKPPVETPVGKVGLSICYDLRFPELSLSLRNLGSEILTFPSAFTFATGASHWEILLRARAIETQCYVVAAAQTGHHNKKRASWGHAMVVDPWGAVIAQCSEGVNFAIAEIDLRSLNKTRLSMPVVNHRRTDLYPTMKPNADDGRSEALLDSYRFGQVTVPSSAVFYSTALTIAFTNKKCVVPGHVLVSSIRCAERMADLTSVEMSDLFDVVHKIANKIEKYYGCTSSSIVIQDGPEAGQTIKHVHVHILPRKEKDYLNNDDIYVELQRHDKVGSGWRTEEEMNAEAELLRKLFK